MDVIEIIKLVADVGLTAVAAGILLFLAYRMFVKQQDWLEDFIKDKVTYLRHPTAEESSAVDVVNNKIYQEMRGVLNALEADRSYVFLYHNGGISTSGLSFQKMSCICEVVGRGVLPMSSYSQGLYRSSYTLFCDYLKEKGEIAVPDSKVLAGVDEFLYQELVGRHSESSYFRALKDINGHVVGFLGLDYCSKNTKIEDEAVLRLLKSVSLKVSSLVDVRDEVK